MVSKWQTSRNVGVRETVVAKFLITEIATTAQTLAVSLGKIVLEIVSIFNQEKI
jgi:hypothetical protein